MKLDILVFAAHPDDAELGCGGTLFSHIAQGYSAGIVDFTRGELGTRGTPEKRLQEAEAASRLFGLSARRNLNFRDGFFKHDEEHVLQLVQMLRLYQPSILLANAPHDRHPDHGRAAAMVKDAVFLSGLAKIETEWQGAPQQAWRPRQVLHYIQDQYLEPDIVVDISNYWEKKVTAIEAYASQFYNGPDDKEPETYISGRHFLKSVEARAIDMGHKVGVDYGEGFVSDKKLGVKDLCQLVTYK
jgi:N-acetylglucosamine malate deacetylase 1